MKKICESCRKSIETTKDNYYESREGDYFICEECGAIELSLSQYGYYLEEHFNNPDLMLDDNLINVDFFDYYEEGECHSLWKCPSY